MFVDLQSSTRHRNYIPTSCSFLCRSKNLLYDVRLSKKVSTAHMVGF